MNAYEPAVLASEDVVARIDTLMRKRRDTLMSELRAIEDYLHMQPKERVLCPQCLRERNMARVAARPSSHR